MANKYGARKVRLDGHWFDSKREAKYYRLYKHMLECGEIEELKLQPKFELQEHFRDSEGHMERAITYKADFSFCYPDGQKVVVEVKGFRTRDYLIRRKLFKYKYRDILFLEVH